MPFVFNTETRTEIVNNSDELDIGKFYEGANGTKYYAADTYGELEFLIRFDPSKFKFPTLVPLKGHHESPTFPLTILPNSTSVIIISE